MKFSLSLFATVVSLGGAFASNVLDLTPDDFHDIVGKGKPALVELYASICLIVYTANRLLSSEPHVCSPCGHSYCAECVVDWMNKNVRLRNHFICYTVLTLVTGP